MSREKFDAIDTDGDGFITAAELKASLEGEESGVTEDQMATIVGLADDDGDQKISPEEYENLLG